MRNIFLVFTFSLLLVTSLLFGQETGILYMNKTSSGYVWETFEDGKVQSKYNGEIKNGKPNGFGFQTYKNGNKYFGEHKNGLPNGQGRSIYPDGSMYLGEYKDGKFHGQGTFIWNDGYYHEGEFMDGVPNGQGTETLPNGQLVGEYKDGKPWNVKGYDKERNIIGKWVNGVKQ